jgi:hypothetical protein
VQQHGTGVTGPQQLPNPARRWGKRLPGIHVQLQEKTFSVQYHLRAQAVPSRLSLPLLSMDALKVDVGECALLGVFTTFAAYVTLVWA